MILRRSWSPQVMLSLYFWSRGMRSSSQRSPTDVMSFCQHKHVLHNSLTDAFTVSGHCHVLELNPDFSTEHLQQKEDILWPTKAAHYYSKPNMDQLIKSLSSYLKEHGPHPCHVHEHDPWVDARPAVEGVAGKAVVPSDTGFLVLRGHGGQLGGIKLGQECPQAVHRLEEEDVWVDIHNRVDVLEYQLHRRTKTKMSLRTLILCMFFSVLNGAYCF